jgi:hypothetical protein
MTKTAPITQTPVSYMSPTINKKPTTSEIDDIFTCKAITVSQKNDQQNSSSGLKQQKKKKGKKKSKPTQLAEPKRPPPEIFLDPSAQQSFAPTPKTISDDRPAPPRKKQKVVETKLDQEKFRDSRGTGPRKPIIPYYEFRLAQQPLPGRTTDEGLKIYKEDELGINAEAGGQSNPSFDVLFTSCQERHYVPLIVIAVSVLPLLSSKKKIDRV